MHPPDTVQITTNISSNITNAIHFSTPPTLAHQLPYPHQHINHVTLVTMSPTLACQPRKPSQYAAHASTLACHPRKHATHATHASTPPTLARHLCKHTIDVTHATTPLTQTRQPRHPRQHVQHTISQTHFTGINTSELFKFKEK